MLASQSSKASPGRRAARRDGLAADRRPPRLQSFASLANASVGGVYVFGGINSGAAPIAPYAQTPASAAQTAVDAAFQATFGFATPRPA